MPASAPWDLAARAWQAPAASSHAAGCGELLNICCAVFRATVSDWTPLSLRPLIPSRSSTPPPSIAPLHPWLQLFLESHLDAAQLAQLRQLWHDYKQKVIDAWQRYDGVAEQVKTGRLALRFQTVNCGITHTLLLPQYFSTPWGPLHAHCRCHSRQAHTLLIVTCMASRPRRVRR